MANAGLKQLNRILRQRNQIARAIAPAAQRMGMRRGEMMLAAMEAAKSGEGPVLMIRKAEAVGFSEHMSLMMGEISQSLGVPAELMRSGMRAG